MTRDESLHRDPVEELAEEFLARRRRGEGPSVEEYARRHPQLAGRIRELFPTLELMENLKPRRSEQEESAPASPPEADDLPIRRLGDYRIIREIGRGGMGVVYEAEQESLSRRVAVKVLPGVFLSSPKSLRRFRREARAAARLHHTNIIPIFGVGEQDGIHYYVMQYIHGQGLDQVLAELSQKRREATGRAVQDVTPALGPAQDRGGGGRVAQTLLWGGFATSPDRPPPQDAAAEASPGGERFEAARPSGTGPAAPESPRPEGGDSPGSLPEAQTSSGGGARTAERVDLPGPAEAGQAYWRSVAGIGIQAAGALHYAHHQGTLHRDVKPGNLLLDTQGTVWVADFGLAKLAEQEDLTRSGDVVGTLRYMAPEQFDGLSDPRTDVYGLGLTLYELLTLQPAFNETDRARLIRQVAHEEPPAPRKLNPAVPRDLETVVLKAIARDPGHRYATAADLAEDLERFLEDRPVRARRTSPLARLWRWCRRNKAVAALSAVALGLLVAVAVVASIGYARTAAALARESEERARADQQRHKAEAEYGRAEANLRVAMQAFEDIFHRIVADPVYQPRQPLQDESVPDGSPDEDAPWEVHGWTSLVTDKDAAVLQTMLKFYDRFAEQNAENVALQKETAQAHRRMGEIYQRLGQYDDAERAYRTALETYRRLLRENGQTGIAAETAAVCNRLGSVCRVTGRLPEAVQFHLSARDLLLEQPQETAHSPQFRFELAQAYNHLGAGASARGLWPGGAWPGSKPGASPAAPPDPAANHVRALEILRKLAEEWPENPEYRLALARTYRDLAGATGRRSRGEDAAAARQEAVRLLERLVADFPANPDYVFELAETYAATVRRFSRSPPSEAEIGRLRRAVEIETQLVQRYPNVPDYQAALARLHTELARVLQSAGQADEGEKSLRQAIALQKALADRFPEVPQYQVELARDLFLLVFTLRARDKKTEARQTLEEAIRRSEALLGPSGSAPLARVMLARAYASLAEILKQLGETAKAEEAMRKSEQYGGAGTPFPRGPWRPDPYGPFPRPRPKAANGDKKSPNGPADGRGALL